MLEIFCPQCGALILDREGCPECAWHRPVAVAGAVGDVVWQADLRTKLNKPHCYPIVVGMLYCLGTEDGTILALDVASGEVVWEHRLDAGLLAHALATDGTRLFVGGEDISPIPHAGRALLALDLTTHEVAWQSPTEAHSLSAATVADGLVLFTATDGYLRAVDALSGEPRWSIPHPYWSPAPPLVWGDLVCVGGRDATLSVYDMRTGEQRWQHGAGNWFAHPLVMESGTVYALAWDGHLYALDLESGALLWERTGERSHGFTTPPAVANGAVYLGSRLYRSEGEERMPGYGMVALNAVDGTERWRFCTVKHIFTPPAVAEGYVFFGANDGSLYAIDADLGQLAWQVQVTSRAVTLPRVAGDLVCFGGRDGIVHAVRWREVPMEVIATPEAYLKEDRLEEATAAYALQGDLVAAADIYAERVQNLDRAQKLYVAANQPEKAAALLETMGRHREAAQFFEKAGNKVRAAQAWESARDYRRARDLYQETDDRPGLARVLEDLEDFLGAARLHQDLANLEEAARLYARGGDRGMEAEIYHRLGWDDRAVEIWNQLDRWERSVDSLSRRGNLRGAARILEQHDRLPRARDLYEQAEAFAEALRVSQTLEDWESVATLAERVGDYAQAADTWLRVPDADRAANAYVEAAKRALNADLIDGVRVAALYERACELYTDPLYDEDKARACSRMVARFRRLPELTVQVTSAAGLVEDQYNPLSVVVTNRGWGVARNIHVHVEGGFDVDGDDLVRGLPPERSRNLHLSVKPRQGYFGAAVRLQILVTYEFGDHEAGELSYQDFVPVSSSSLLSGLLRSATPLNINIQELYQNSRKVGGDYLESGSQKAEGDVMGDGSHKAEGDILSGEAQKGDRVEISRTSAVPGSSNGPRVVVREGVGPVRRCPICNVPTNDPSLRYCMECGAPMPAPEEMCGDTPQALQVERDSGTEGQ